MSVGTRIIAISSSLERSREPSMPRFEASVQRGRARRLTVVLQRHNELFLASAESVYRHIHFATTKIALDGKYAVVSSRLPEFIPRRS